MNLHNLNLNLSPFKPLVPFWTGHSQTLLGHFIPSPEVSVSLQKEILTLPDGDQLLLQYKDNHSKYTVSIYHGLGGNAKSDYMRRSAELAQRMGWNFVLVNHRAASHEAHSKKSYHSGRGEDAEAVIQWCRKRFLNSKQIALGFSMSGSILLNLLTKRYGAEQPDFGIVVNAPLKLDRAAELLTKNFSKIYDIRFYLILKKIIQSRESMKLPLLARTLDIDDIYTSKKNGFKDRHDYYQQCSTWSYLNQIKTPTFVLSSMDDPFVEGQLYREAQWPECVHLTVTDTGGHMGYIHNKKIDSIAGYRWLDYYLQNVFNKILDLA